MELLRASLGGAFQRRRRSIDREVGARGYGVRLPCHHASTGGVAGVRSCRDAWRAVVWGAGPDLGVSLRDVEHDRAWQDAQVDRELRENWWLHASPWKRLLVTAWLVLASGAIGAGLGFAEGSGWLPWTLVGAAWGLLPLLLWSRRFLTWNARQNNPTDETLRRGATAVQRDGIRTDGDVGMKHEPYWPQNPADP